jgi:hypothetical protein
MHSPSPQLIVLCPAPPQSLSGVTQEGAAAVNVALKVAVERPAKSFAFAPQFI